MKKKPPKSWDTLASDLKKLRKPILTPEQIERANKIFEQIEKEQEAEKNKKKIARQLEV